MIRQHSGSLSNIGLEIGRNGLNLTALLTLKMAENELCYRTVDEGYSAHLRKLLVVRSRAKLNSND